MEPIVFACVALLLIVLVLGMPSTKKNHDRTAHEETLAAMQQRADEAKEEITQQQRAYRAELSRVARNHAAADRRR